jgi:hypothetical protein
MAGRQSTGPLDVDKFCRRLGDQIQAAAALDDDRACAATLRTLAGYLATKDLRIVQTAWDADRAPPDPTITARFDGRCSTCGGPVRAGEQIVYDSETRRVRHPQCEGQA